MKKSRLAAVLAVLTLSAVVAQADISVDWIVGGGFYLNDGVTAANPVLVQIIYTTEATPLIPTGLGPAPEVEDGLNYIVIDSLVINADYGYDGLTHHVESALYGAGNVYAVVWDAAAPGAGDYYYLSALSAVPNVNLGATPPPIPTGFNVNDGIDDPSYGADFVDNEWQPIPEPGTILLGLVGIGTLLARRRAKARS